MTYHADCGIIIMRGDSMQYMTTKEAAEKVISDSGWDWAYVEEN